MTLREATGAPRWQERRLREINAILEECKRELATNFDCPSEQILGFYGAKLKIDSREMLQAIYRYDERTRQGVYRER